MLLDQAVSASPDTSESVGRIVGVRVVVDRSAESGRFVSATAKPMKVLRADRCQCCNTSLDHGAHNVFDEDGRTQNIAALLHDYIGKQLNESDGIDYAICDPCWHQLLQCHAFKQKCIQANALAGDDNPQAGHRCLAPTKTTSPLADPYGRRRQQPQPDAISGRTNDNVQLTIDRQLLEYTADGMVIEYLDDDDLYDDDAGHTFGDMDEMCASDLTSILVEPSSCDRFGKRTLF